ncbi:AI-2E family transporter [Bacillus sp. 2205SS5-2]|uniref:AI-2E family transporter n=1 Tax=Bacillus sp. 2205SS5-2 TaxID=3109031 RepID=UPI003004D034
MERKDYVTWLYRLSLSLLVLLFIYILYLLAPVWHPFLKVLIIALSPFLIGGFITYLLHPVVEKLHSAGIPRISALIIIYVFFFGGIGYGLYKGFPNLVEQLRQLSLQAPTYAKEYKGWLSIIQQETASWPDGLQDQLEEMIHGLEKWANSLVDKLIRLLLSLLNKAFLIIIIPFVSFYLLKDIIKVKRFASKITPINWRKKASLFIHDLDESLGGYIRGQLLICFIIGALSFAAFWLIGINYPLILGLFVGFTNIIPYFGPIVGALPALVIASTMSVNMMVYVVLIIVVLQFLEGNILSPYIVGKSLHMHPLFIMGALVVGGELGGVLGLIVAVPFLAVIKTALIYGKNHFIS